LKKFRVYTHSTENGVYQIGRTCYQPCTGARWETTMKDCNRENLSEVEATSPEEAIKKLIQERTK